MHQFNMQTIISLAAIYFLNLGKFRLLNGDDYVNCFGFMQQLKVINDIKPF